MKTTTAERKVLEATGRKINVQRADSWIGSSNACFRSGVKASKKWACSVYDSYFKCWVEPNNYYDTLNELIQYQNYKG